MFKLIYYRKKAEVTDVRYFSSMDEFINWYNRQMALEPISILDFHDTIKKESD